MLTAEVQLTDELFTHMDDADGAQTTWNSTRVYEWATANNWPVIRVAVDEDHARYCFEKRGFEDARIPDLLSNPDYMLKPILFIALPDGSHLLIDGTHRYVLYYKFNQASIPAMIIPLDQVQEYIVTDVPQISEAELMAPSMLPEIRRAMRNQS